VNVIETELSIWSIHRLPTGSLAVELKSRLSGTPPVCAVLKPEEALKIGEAIIKGVLPPANFVPKPYPVEIPPTLVIPSGGA
jgi:hypothetical protein